MERIESSSEVEIEIQDIEAALHNLLQPETSSFASRTSPIKLGVSASHSSEDDPTVSLQDLSGTVVDDTVKETNSIDEEIPPDSDLIPSYVEELVDRNIELQDKIAQLEDQLHTQQFEQMAMKKEIHFLRSENGKFRQVREKSSKPKKRTPTIWDEKITPQLLKESTPSADFLSLWVSGKPMLANFEVAQAQIRRHEKEIRRLQDRLQRSSDKADAARKQRIEFQRATRLLLHRQRSQLKNAVKRLRYLVHDRRKLRDLHQQKLAYIQALERKLLQQHSATSERMVADRSLVTADNQQVQEEEYICPTVKAIVSTDDPNSAMKKPSDGCLTLDDLVDSKPMATREVNERKEEPTSIDRVLESTGKFYDQFMAYYN